MFATSEQCTFREAIENTRVEEVQQLLQNGFDLAAGNNVAFDVAGKLGTLWP